MVEIESKDIDAVYLVHWECSECEASNTNEEDNQSGNKINECWECQTKTKVKWEKK